MLKFLFPLFFVGLIAPYFSSGCLCPQGGIVERSEAIRRDLCASDNVYTGQVLTATCNCIPNNSTLSSSLKCQHYQINQDTGNILATVLTNGECESEGYTIKPFCSALGDSLAGNELSVEGPVPTDIGEEVDLTDIFGRCDLACPFNTRGDLNLITQPCIYNVRVTEVFKGTHTMDDVVEVLGPDKGSSLGSSCGSPGGRLQLGTSYVVGIGGVCGGLKEWTALSNFREEEIELLQNAVEVCQAEVATTTIVSTTNAAVAVIPTVMNSLYIIVLITAALN